mgnify:CR=1 FL=1
MPKSIERRELDRDRRLAERMKDKRRTAERTFAAMLIESGRLSERDDNWISIGYTGRKRR